MSEKKNNHIIDAKKFIKGYWDYFLDLEAQFFETKRYVAFDKANAKAFSIEYLKLYQAVCSEIDVVGKEMAQVLLRGSKSDYDGIKKWGFQIQQRFPDLKDCHVLFHDEELIQPFKDWEYYKAKSKDGKNIIKEKDEKSIPWWRSYNKVKHHRIGLIEETSHFHLANQDNLIKAFAALFLLESLFLVEHLKVDKSIIAQSKLFQIVKSSK